MGHTSRNQKTRQRQNATATRKRRSHRGYLATHPRRPQEGGGVNTAEDMGGRQGGRSPFAADAAGGKNIGPAASVARDWGIHSESHYEMTLATPPRGMGSSNPTPSQCE